MTTDVSVIVEVVGVGLLGPGFATWAAGAPLLREPQGWGPAPTVVPAPERLPATERRRAGTVVKAALVAADQAVAMAGADAALLPTVFTSSTGDPANCHILCEALARPHAERLVSPTRFTNSVHNAPAGYWHIAAASRAASTSLAAFDASFAAGLLEAAAQCVSSGAPVLLVAADVPYPEPLHAKRPLPDSAAVALVLAPPGGSGGGRRIGIRIEGSVEPTRCAHAGLEAQRLAIPALRALPLLQALAGSTATGVVIEGLSGQHLRLDVAATR
jgi:Beta-ketoacyl synthase, N-terminal domain